MHTNLVRSLVAGAVAAITTVATLAGGVDIANAAGNDCTPYFVRAADGTLRLEWPQGCTPVAPGSFDLGDDPVLPPINPPRCNHLEIGDLGVVGVEPDPHHWWWEVSFRNEINGWCNEVFTAEMINLSVAGRREISNFTVAQLRGLGAGSHWIVNSGFPCHYRATLYLGADILTTFSDDRRPDGCVDEADPVRGPGGALPDLSDVAVLPALPEFVLPESEGDAPEDPAEGVEPGGGPEQAGVGDEPGMPIGDGGVEGGNGALGGDDAATGEANEASDETNDETNDEASGTAGGERAAEEEIPDTGAESSTVMVGLGLLVVGAGLGLTALSLSRRRRQA